MFCTPVVKAYPASKPTPVLSESVAVVKFCTPKTSRPMAVVLEPSVSPLYAARPIAMLKSASVSASPANEPTRTFCSPVVTDTPVL